MGENVIVVEGTIFRAFYGGRERGPCLQVGDDVVLSRAAAIAAARAILRHYGEAEG
jgi:hypothetical protein